MVSAAHSGKGQDTEALQAAVQAIDSHLEALERERQQMVLRMDELARARDRLVDEVVRSRASHPTDGERHGTAPIFAAPARFDPYWTTEFWEQGQPTLAQAIVEVLRRAEGAPLTNAQIAEAIEEADWFSESTEFAPGTLNATLHRLDSTPSCPVHRLRKGYFQWVQS